jgi:hypothetical protein
MLHVHPSTNVRKWPSGAWPAGAVMGDMLKGSGYAPGTWMTKGLVLILNGAVWPPVMMSAGLGSRVVTNTGIPNSQFDSSLGIRIDATSSNQWINAPSKAFESGGGTQWTMVIAGAAGGTTTPNTDTKGALSFAFSLSPTTTNRIGMTIYGPAHGTASLAGKARVYYSTPSTVFAEVTSVMAGTNSYSVYAAVFNGTGAANTDKIKFYKDGVNQPLTYTGAIPTTTLGLDPNEIAFCRNYTGSTANYNGGVYWMGLCYNRALSQIELAQMTGRYFLWNAYKRSLTAQKVFKAAAVAGGGWFRFLSPRLVGVGLAPAAPPPGPYSDTFDSYANGALLDAQPGWMTFPGQLSMVVTKPGATGEVGAPDNSGVSALNYSTAVYGDAQYSEITFGAATATSVNIGACISMIPGTSSATNSYYFATYSLITGSLSSIGMGKQVSGFGAVSLASTTNVFWTTGDKLRITKTGTGSAQRLTLTKNGANVTGFVNIEPGAANGGYITGGQAGIVGGGVGAMRIASWTSG